MPGVRAAARAARNRGVEADPLSRPRARSHHTGDLVAEDEWTAQRCVADAAFLEPVQIGAAKPHGLHLKQEFAVGWFRRRFLVEAQVMPVVQT